MYKFMGLLALVVASGVVVSTAPGAELKTQNVLLVTIDGLRWQEVFRGTDAGVANQVFGGVSVRALERVEARFAGRSRHEQRRILMPFVWDEIAARGQIHGNRDTNSPMRVTNPAMISYPGYSEMLSGFADPEITSNKRVPNPNVTVLEWLDQQPEFAGRIVALAAWSTFGYIFNVERSGLPLWLTNQHSDPATASPRLLEIEQWMEDVPTKGIDEHYDAFVFRAALDMIETKRPRLLFVGFGEPDTDAHARKYDRYLAAISRNDRFIRELWERLQSLPQYRGSTTLIVTTDHGRGASPQEWANHSKDAPGSDETWLAVLGPDTPALGERRDTPMITTAQVAATVAKFLGRDFQAAFPHAAGPLADVFHEPAKQER